MGSIVSCATRNEVEQQTDQQQVMHRRHAAYAKYFAVLEQGLKAVSEMQEHELGGELRFHFLAFDALQVLKMDLARAEMDLDSVGEASLADSLPHNAGPEDEEEGEIRRLEAAMSSEEEEPSEDMEIYTQQLEGRQTSRLVAQLLRLSQHRLASTFFWKRLRHRRCERWMAFERAHSASLSRLDFATLPERSKALYFAKVNDLIEQDREERARRRLDEEQTRNLQRMRELASEIELAGAGFDVLTSLRHDDELMEDERELMLHSLEQEMELMEELRSLEQEMIIYDKTTPTSIVDQLPCRTSAGGPDEDEKECAVCLSQFANGDLVRLLPCRHEFHAHCIDKWLLEKDRRCPCCRVDVCKDVCAGAVMEGMGGNTESAGVRVSIRT